MKWLDNVPAPEDCEPLEGIDEWVLRGGARALPPRAQSAGSVLTGTLTSADVGGPHTRSRGLDDDEEEDDAHYDGGRHHRPHEYRAALGEVQRGAGAKGGAAVQRRALKGFDLNVLDGGLGCEELRGAAVVGGGNATKQATQAPVRAASAAVGGKGAAKAPLRGVSASRRGNGSGLPVPRGASARGTAATKPPAAQPLPAIRGASAPGSKKPWGGGGTQKGGGGGPRLERGLSAHRRDPAVIPGRVPSAGRQRVDHWGSVAGAASSAEAQERRDAAALRRAERMGGKGPPVAMGARRQPSSRATTAPSVPPAERSRRLKLQVCVCV